jgi:hypothetical protein
MPLSIMLKRPSNDNSFLAHLPKGNTSKKIWASKKLVTGSNGIMVAQTFCDIFFMKKRHQISKYKQFSG